MVITAVKRLMVQLPPQPQDIEAHDLDIAPGKSGYFGRCVCVMYFLKRHDDRVSVCVYTVHLCTLQP